MAAEATVSRGNASLTSDENQTSTDSHEDVSINSRAYQLEMLDQSLKGNVIVVMDTGTGKTHVAVLRIKKELEVAPADKLIWFLAPTKELCSQQFGVLQSQISSVQIKLFTSDDNVARWTEKENWDVVLTNVNIVVSTYGVLHEALCNGVVGMSSLSLIVFDEAHNCIKRSPGSKIMKDFYFPRKEADLPVPHILGLTPSAVMGNKPNALENLEKILDSTCRSPRIEREELLQHANRPELKQIEYEGNGVNPNNACGTDAMKKLVIAHENLNIYDDPEILRLRTTDTEVSRNQMERALKKNKTFMQEQMKSFRRRSEEIFRALGSWAADFYISQVIMNCVQSADSKDISLLDWDDSEKQYLANAIRSINVTLETLSDLPEESISRKVRALLDFLSSCEKETTGIIFVKERAIAYMLHRVLSEHPESRQKLRCEALVGTSQRPRGRRDICDLPNSANALEKFRSGQVNLLIATSVLEEGIDVPQCELVICFDEPANIKSYIQCRGRARLPGSKWVVLLDTTSESQIKQLQKWESDMELRYAEGQRNIQKFADIESSETEQRLSRQFRVQSTNALLDMENAKGRLQCFCSRLSSHYSVHMRPEYIILDEGEEDGGLDGQHLISAKVILPPTLESSLRVGRSRLLWRSEKNATKDAAFETYIALYHAGLINDNLLPLSFTEPLKYIEKAEAIVEVDEQYNPWPRIAQAWKKKEKLQRRDVTLKDECGLTRWKVQMLIPANLPNMESIQIYWDDSTEFEIEIGSPTWVQNLESTIDNTERLLQLAYGRHWEIKKLKHVVDFKAEDMEIVNSQLQSTSLTPQRHINRSVGLSESAKDFAYPFSFLSWLWGMPRTGVAADYHEEYETFIEDDPFMFQDHWIRRSDFLHPVAQHAGPDKQEDFDELSHSLSTMDIATTQFQFGRLIPSILHKLEVQLVVEELCTTVLADVKLSSHELVRTAISTPVAREPENYQKLEFLGDSVLKFLVTLFVSSKYANWPEGYLSSKKDTIVSNSRLGRAAMELGLHKFILTKVFTGRKWRPHYVENLMEDEEVGKRSISSKTIADVFESLIGAGWKMGGHSTSLSIIKVFLPEVDLPSLEVGRTRLFDLAPAETLLPANLCHLETLAGYCFRKKSLLIQAMSHSSDSTAIASYERIEFLGDALLEIIVVNELLVYDQRISHSLMHLYKTALVNNDYLGFIALEWSITQRKTSLKEDIKSGDHLKVESEFSLPLWRFMKHGIYGIGQKQCEIERRHALLRCDIKEAISSGMEYPWALLARLNAYKFYADIVESLLGAVWVDSGSMDVCKHVLSRMGILQYLHRIVQDRVHVLHPREELNILADGKEVEYLAQQIDDGSDEWTCTVFVDKISVSHLARGVSEDEVRTKAAENAVFVLRYANGRTGSPVAYGGRVSQN